MIKSTSFELGLIGLLLLGFLFKFGCGKENQLRPNPGGHKTSSPSQEIRILTINVWSGLTYKGFFKMGRHLDNSSKRYELLISEIRKLDPDIIALQEANPLPHYAKRLAADLGYQVIYSVTLGGIRFGSLGIPTNMREGQAILVKKPWTIEDLGKKRLGGKGIVTNGFCFHLGEITQALLGRAVVNGKPLLIYNIHLHSGPSCDPALNAALERLSRQLPQEKVEEAKKGVEKVIERRRDEMANLIKFIEETLPVNTPAVLLGDFNTTSESGELEPLLAHGKWVDSFRLKNPHEEGVTWDPANNPNFHQEKVTSTPYDLLHAYQDRYSQRIDFIFVNNNIPRDHILESHVVLTPANGFSASDHYGVLTTLKW